jgi:hypothetical protein
MHLKVALLILTITAAVVHLGLIDRPLPQPMVVLPHPEDIQVQPSLPPGVQTGYLESKRGNVVLMFQCSGPSGRGITYLRQGKNTLYIYKKPCWSI